MTTQKKQMLDTPFKKEVFEGLTAYPKYLSSKYIYDAQGDKLFQDIMAMPSYYLTNCEFEILSNQTEAIATFFENTQTGFDLIELGAGDGEKTKVLLHHLAAKNSNFTYKPIDISQHAINNLSETLATEIPTISVAAEKGEYFEILTKIKTYSNRKKVIMVLGSNIGNLLHPRAIEFLSQLKEAMTKEDLLFVGFDQKKHPQIILDAYNDPEGITAAFNKNLLVRINREMDGDFDTSKFIHWERYDPETGTAKSYLAAKETQTVSIKALDLTITFDPWETIHTEISQKYDDKTVAWLATESGLEIVTSFTNSKAYYKNYLFKIKQ
jgi:dimethylhistidine N-methyltransferase